MPKYEIAEMRRTVMDTPISKQRICSDHKIITTDIKLRLRANKKKITANKSYNWTLLKQNEEIRRAFTKTLINHFSSLQNRDTENISSANTRYNHFEEDCKEAASKEIPLKTKQEKLIPWESVKILPNRETLHWPLI